MSKKNCLFGPSEILLWAKFRSKKIVTKPKKPAAGPDITIEYAGSVIMVAPRSQVGCEWLSSDRPVHFALRELDTVLKEARRARLKIETPWDEDERGVDEV
jgi:hypothetical protein